MLLAAQQKQIDSEIVELERSLGSIDKEIALGLTHAAREAGVRVVLADGPMESAKPAAGAAAADSLEKYLDRVLNVIPDGVEKALTIGKVTKSVDIEDPTIVASCVRKLLKTGKITSVGERRAKRYFRPAKQLVQVKK